MIHYYGNGPQQFIFDDQGLGSAINVITAGDAIALLQKLKSLGNAKRPLKLFLIPGDGHGFLENYAPCYGESGFTLPAESLDMSANTDQNP